MLSFNISKPAAKPALPLEPGEQYRFHFDAGKCIGCKCCEVACHEQNDTPAAVKWRKVGEVEGGEFPRTVRLYISMACNHCLEPPCMLGCPVDAYYKDETTGAVRMRDNACIGCGYCTWNCPYEAPQFHPDTHTVTKCDFCHNRLTAGDLPACVNACPSGALEIERVSQAAWREDHTAGNSPGLPESSITLSTTRITLPENKGVGLDRIDDHRLRPEKPHYALVFMLVLTQLSVGGFLALFVSEILSHLLPISPLLEHFLKTGPLAMLATGALALGMSVLHLGRPLFAYRAIKMWRRSWLSREVVCLCLFGLFAAVYSLLRWSGAAAPGGAAVSSGTVLASGTAAPGGMVAPWLMTTLVVLVAITGMGGIYSSARIYMVPARPSWNNIRTPIAFFATAFILGPLMALLVFSQAANATSIPLTQNGGGLISKILVALTLIAGLFQLSSILVKLFYILSRDEVELRGSAKLLTEWFRLPFLFRIGSLVLTLVGVPLTLLGFSSSGTVDPLMSVWVGGLLALALTSELLGRYLFFVSVVPKNRPGGYF